MHLFSKKLIGMVNVYIDNLWQQQAFYHGESPS